MKIYAISDIHGCSKTFKNLLGRLGLNKTDKLFLLGDFVDRGPDSKGVLDCIFKLMEDGFDVQCLKGNHEEMMLDGEAKTARFSSWLHAGGYETLDSFGVMSPREIPDLYKDFCRNLPHYLEYDKYIFVHAGLNFKILNPLRDTENMLWIRPWDMKINKQWLGDRYVIHGHTPVIKEDIETDLMMFDLGRVIDIDNGCFTAGRSSGKGSLCALELTVRDLIFEKCIDDTSSFYKRH